jgi:hypothetical protein
MRTAETVLNIIRERFTLRLLESDVIRKRSCVVRRGAIGIVPAMVTRWSPTLLSCPVLKTSGVGDNLAEFNYAGTLHYINTRRLSVSLRSN